MNWTALESARYSRCRDTAAMRFCQAMLEAAEIFGNHLPEAFAGYGREETKFPVEYPTACMIKKPPPMIGRVMICR